MALATMGGFSVRAHGYPVGLDMDGIRRLLDLCQVVMQLHLEPGFGGAAKALARRIAISGEIPHVPFTTRDRVWRVTPSHFAPSVTVRPSGSRQLIFTDKPGWAGVSFAWQPP